MGTDGKPGKDMEWQILKEVSLNPITLYSIAVGIGSFLFGVLVFSVLSAIAYIMILAGLLSVGIGVLSWIINYFFRYETIANQCMNRFTQSAEDERRREIEILRQKLTADGDARTEKLLDDLMTLTSVFQNVKHWNIDSYSQYEITQKVSALFEEGIRQLDQTLHLWHTSQSLNMGSVREAIDKQREELIRDLSASVIHLGQVLSHLQEMALSEHTQPLSTIVQELDATMEIAQRVQERMNKFDIDQNRIAS